MTTAEPAFPKSLDPIKAELTAYYRELPRLLAEGHAGRFALIKGDSVVGLYDENALAAAAGCRLGVPFLSQRIDADDRDWLAVYFEPPAPPRPPELVFRGSAERVQTEFLTYVRELPGLLAAGNDRRFVLLKGDEVVGVYDDDRDANRDGAARYGDDPYLVQWIKRRDLADLAPFFPELAGGVG